MSAPQINGNMAAPMVVEDSLALREALVRACRVCAENAASEDSAAEAKDYAQAALSFAQAVITLDPSRLAGGDTPEARAASVPVARDGDRDGVIGES